MSIMNEINFDELEHIRQSNNRDAQYQLKRVGDGKFIISNKGKSIIGHDSTKGVDARGGNGLVLLACRPKDDKRNARGLLNGAVGKTFTSSKLEELIEKNLPKAECYDFEFFQEYQDGKYFKLVPVPSDDADQAEQDTAEDDSVPEGTESGIDAETATADETTSNVNDEF